MELISRLDIYFFLVFCVTFCICSFICYKLNIRKFIKNRKDKLIVHGVFLAIIIISCFSIQFMNMSDKAITYANYSIIAINIGLAFGITINNIWCKE